MRKPMNEPILEYKNSSEERKCLEKALNELASNPIDVPLVIGKEKITHGLEKKQIIVRFNKKN